LAVVAIALERFLADAVEDITGPGSQVTGTGTRLRSKTTRLAVSYLVGCPGDLAHVIVSAGLQRGRGQDDDDDSDEQDPAHTGQLTR
jgi:hypothetical protein